jgi:hypothetical protein
MAIPRHARTRTLTEALLTERLERQAAQMRAFAEAGNDSASGRAECLSYDMADTREELARVRAGATLVEYYDGAIGRWQLAD